jgi:hypothetical protein
MDVKQINQAIMFGTFTDIELNSMIDAVRWNRTGLQRRVKADLQQGDTVEWYSQKRGRAAQGVVTKIAIKYVTVREGSTLWKVPANMLTRVEAKELA